MYLNVGFPGEPAPELFQKSHALTH